MNLELPLGAPAAEERPYSVTEVVEGARRWIQELPAVWVEGEVSGFKVAPGGQWYFTLKDRASAMSCVLWADDARRLGAPLEDGIKVYARGALSVFARRGTLQFTVRQVLPTAEGGWHALRTEQARQALAKDGLLAPERKRPLPAYPRCIGVVTSPDGAAWHDIVAVVARRWPYCRLVRIGARVQGEGAPGDIRRALALAARCPDLDLLIVGRGGGSREDLLAFDDEQVARAVAASPVPTISAVGHEVDVTLTDLVADLRAPTPSAAAEKAVPDRRAVAGMLDALGARVARGAGRPVELATARLAATAGRLHAGVGRRVQGAGERLRAADLRLRAASAARLAGARSAIERLGAALEAFSPLRVLERGYAVARAADGRVLRRVADFPAGTPFRLRLADGDVPARSEGPA